MSASPRLLGDARRACSLAAWISCHTCAESTWRVRPFVPGDVERVEPLLGRPHVIADDGDEVVEHDDLAHAGDRLRRAVVDMPDLAAEHRAGRDGRELHARRHHVDAVDRLAVDLVGRVEPLERLADQREVLRVLQRRIGGRRAVGARSTSAP